MPKIKTTSPARSQGGITTPKRKTTRGSRSLCSPAMSTASGRLTSLADQFKDKNMESFALSPLNGRSVLNDNTEIEEPRRKSWWKKLDENSHDVMEILEDNKLTVNNTVEEFIDMEVLSQEKKNYTLDLPESSDNESINSIVLPQRRLFTQKENQPQKQYGHLIENRESLAKLHKTNTANIDKAVSVGTRELFQNTKRSKPIFPAALLNISPNKTAADKTKENLLADPKPQVRNIFGNRPAHKRKNMFADFIVSESEDEIPEIQPKVFGFHKKLEQRRISSISKGRDASPASSITTDIEMDFKMLLPSSTMVENQLEDNMLADNTPIKRARLSKLSEAKESEAGTLQTNTTSDKTKQSNKSVASKDKSKASPEIKDKSLNSSRTTRSMLKNVSKRDENVNTSVKQDAKSNKSRTKIPSKGNELDVIKSKSDTDKHNASLNKSQKQNKTRNSQKAIETEIESEEIVVNARNDVTRVINKSKNKSLSNTTATNKSFNEKERTVTLRVHDKVNKTGSNDIKQNEQDDENNFTLEYENDEVLEEAEIHNEPNENQKENTKNHNTVVLEKNSQETEINKSKSNKSSSTNKSFQQKPAKIVEESVESQTEQYSAVDNVDGNQVQETDNYQNNDEEMINEEIDEGANNSRVDMSDGKVIEENEQENEVEVNVSQDNEEEANESEENEEEMSGSQEKAANESQVENEAREGEDEEEANESDENEDEENESDLNEDEANESQVVEEEANESQEVEEEANESQEVEEESNESQEAEEEANESQEEEKEANKSQEAEEGANKSQEAEEEANESQEAEAANKSQETVHAHASDEENGDGMDEDEEETANESQVNEASANESQEVENDEEESQEVTSEGENEEVEDDQQIDDSDEADNAIASDPEISDDNQADEIELDGDEEQSDNESEQNEREERQIKAQNEIGPVEEIEESPNVTHDTTGRHRNKHLNKSPEVILHDNNYTNLMDSFTAKGRSTSVRKTKSMIKDLIKPSLAPARDSIGFSDGTRNSSAEGSGWDSHRTTRKTLRQTFGKDFTPRKSLRALVMEKSAKRQTEHMEMHSETVKFPLANSTEMPEDSNHHVEDIVESDHEVSRRTRQATLEMYLQKIKEQNLEKDLKMEAEVRNSLKTPVSNSLSLFKVPDKPAPRRPKPTQTKPKKKLKSNIPFDVYLPSEVIEDMKYKPPKRFRAPNASWITKRLYKFLENKLEAKYDYKARVRTEKLVETIYHFAKDLRRHKLAPPDAVDVLKHEFARLDIVRTHFEFYEFFNEYMPKEVRIKVIPDIVNKIALPRHGVFSDILGGNTVHE